MHPDSFRVPDRRTQVEEDPIDWTKSLDTAIHEILNYKSKFNEYDQLIELDLFTLGILNLPEYALPFTNLERFRINGYFTRFPEELLYKLSNLRGVTIASERELEVPNKAFVNCKHLTLISLGSSERLNIDNTDFSNNKKLENLGVKVMDENLLKKLTHQKTVKYMTLSVDSRMCTHELLDKFIPKFSFLSNLIITFKPFNERTLESQIVQDQQKLRGFIIGKMNLLKSIEEQYSSLFDVLIVKMRNQGFESLSNDRNYKEKRIVLR
ncbi:MAG: leucine-rich repeat protein [Candidatus Heimdallarchaeota archaeon]|nr:leucine-rich repeat protein [Candidatus Heimdallarchaeota archaeon]